MVTTEVLVCALTPGSEIGNPSNPSAAVLKEVGDRLSMTEGVKQIQFGMQVENPGVLQMFIDWDHIDSHKAFMQTEVYKPFLQRFLSVAAGAPRLVHADLKPEGGLARALSAPVTEVATFYFDGNVTSGYLEGVNKFAETVEKEGVAGLLGACAGETVEDDNEREGVKGKAVILAIGWESIDAHMAFRETATFKDNIHLLRNGPKQVEMHHVQFMQFVAD